MGDALQILLIGAGIVVAVVLLSMLVPPFKSYWEGFFTDFGQHHAVQLRAWWRARKQRRASAEAAIPAPVPIAGIGGRSLDAVESPAVVVVGTDAQRLASGRVANVVDPIDHGDLIEAVETAIDEAAAAVRADDAQTIAVVLGVPLSGSWAADAELDLARLFAAIFKHRDCPVWLAYEEPIDVSPWPEQVFLETPDSPEIVIQRLIAAGLSELAASHPVIIGRSVRFTRELAARALLLLTSEESLAGMAPSPILPATATRPNYASFIALGVRTGAPWDTGGGTDRDLAVAMELQRAMHERGIRLTAVASEGVAGLLPLTPYRGRVIAWRPATESRMARVATPARPQLPRPSQGVTELEQALSDDEPVRAGQILSTFGRAWIETPEATHYLDLLERARRRFEEGSEAALWARYLLALDAALRTSQPHASWFDDRTCGLAEPHPGLRFLFRSEQMEFTRLRGELARAVSLASRLAPEIDGPVPLDGVASTYAQATARFVLGNLLRAGGRYDLARRYIALARDAYDTVYPSHAVEAMHCRYALAVCDAIDGVPHVELLDDVPEGQLVFARSLVTLTNSQAAWFVNDLERALQFVGEAGRGFRGIGYDRHARRAEDVAALLKLWMELRDQKTFRPIAPERLIRDVVAALDSAIEPLDLRHLRPSAALTVLHFAMTFADHPDARRAIFLPALIQTDSDRHLDLVQLPPAASVTEADSQLRQVLGVGRSRAVPLLPD